MNKMQEFKIVKVVLSAGGKDDELAKAKRLLEYITGKKAQILITQKRIPDFDVRPGLEVGTRVTLRGDEAIEILKKVLGAIDNKLSKRQIVDNHFSFGIKEYIDIPGLEYKRDIGVRGFNITIDFARPGQRIKNKKIKAGKIPRRQHVKKEEIIKYMEDVFKTKFGR